VSKIKVLQIIKSLGRGGAEKLLTETLSLHDQEKFEFHYIYFLPWKDQLVAELKANGGRVTCLPANNNIQLVMQVGRVVKYIRENKIDLIHAHLPWAGIVSRRAGRNANIPVIYTEHNKQERYHFATRWMNLLTMNWLSGIVAVSDDVADSIRKHKPKLSAPLHVILNGVDTMKFNSPDVQCDIRQQLNIDPAAIVVGTIAVFRFQKRLEVWLKCAADFHKKFPQARFIIVGDGPLKSQILKHTSDLGLDDVVYFAGLQTEVRPWLKAMDVYFMSSVFEGLPIALLEAMAMQLPVVTTNAGGIKQVIREGVEGLMCDVQNTEQLTPLLEKMAGDARLRAECGARARDRVISAFSLKTMVRSLEDLYEKSSR
jgi:L-malate glycosyltransferase